MSTSPLHEFYSNKRVLVTGHTGFKGSWLCLMLLQMGCDVGGYALPPEETPDSLYNLSGLASKLRSTFGDLNDLPALQKCLREYKPDIVVHMAAQSLVLPSYEAPLDTFRTNIMGTLHVLEAARHTGSVKAVVNVTTDKCYENNESATAFRESDPMGGHDPYSASKAAAEIVSASYRRSFLAEAGIAMATVRAGNVIGGGDFSRYRLIPDIIRAAKNGQPVELRHPESVRPWQHVLDVLHGYLLLGRALCADGPRYAEAFNFGPDESGITAGTVANRLIAAMEKPPKIISAAHASAHEAKTLYLDNSKAKAMLDWHPLLSPDEAIDLTAAWYRQYLSRSNSVDGITTEQLDAFMKKAAA